MPGIYSAVAPPEQQAKHPVGGIDISAWRKTVLAQGATGINPYDVQAFCFAPVPTSDPIGPLTISLNEPVLSRQRKLQTPTQILYAQAKERERAEKRKKRQEILEKGKEGSRRRQRWENAHFVGVPGAMQPEDQDWEIRRQGPVRRVEYWVVDNSQLDRNWKNVDGKKGLKEMGEGGEVPKDLKKRCRRTKAAKELLGRLEEEVRGFVVEWAESTASPSNPSNSNSNVSATAELEAATANLTIDNGADSSDEEIVFVGRDLSARTKREAEAAARKSTTATKSASKAEKAEAKKAAERQINVIEPLARYFVHVLATYYGLKSWSVEEGRMRVPVIGVKEPKTAAKGKGKKVDVCVPMVPKRMLVDFV